MHRFLIKLIILSASFFFVPNLHAQVGYEDVVYLKNGSIIHGMIIEQIPNQSIKIQTHDGNVFVYIMDEIEKITKERSGKKKQYADVSEISSKPYSGFSVGVTGCIGSGVNPDNKGQGVIGAHVLLGYMHQSVLLAGISAGLNLWNMDLFTNEINPVDLSLALRVFPLKKRVSPIIIADAGFAIQPEGSGNSGGLTFNLGAGARLNMTQKRGLSLSICYKALQVHQSTYYYNNGNNYNNRTYYIDAICLEAGFYF